MARHLLSLLIVSSIAVVHVSANCDRSVLPELTYRLSGNNLAWPCASTKNIYTSTHRYVPRNVIVTRTQLYRDEAFVTMPRLRPGVPFTLGKVAMQRNGCETAVQPFPCWSMQEEGNCQALQSAVDLFLDAHDILWVLDPGVVNTLGQPVRRCPPKVVAFSVKTGKVVKVIDLSEIACDSSRLQYLVVDYDAEGRAFVYISDAGARAILVYDVTEQKSHRVVLPSAVAGGSQADVLYLVLIRKAGSEAGSSSHNVLYFTYLNSPRLFSIKAEHLRRGQGSGAVVDVGPKPEPIVLLGSDNGAGLFLRYKGQSDIFMWNTETCFKAANFLEVQHGGDCRLATQVVPGFKRYMWALESNFHDYIANTAGCNGASVRLHPVVKECED